MRSDPVSLWLVRHGQSLGNVARDRAHAGDHEIIELAERDMDVPLSDLGRAQSRAFGSWLATQDPLVVPNVVVTSPYLRACETAELVLEGAGLDLRIHLDERLREREFGILDLLTRRGIEARFPQEANRRAKLGKFYHRPPGGESWVDVALRLRSLRDSLAREHLDRRVLIITHEVVIALFRYLIEDLTESQVLAINRDRPVANCSLTRYVTGEDERLHLDLEGWVAPLEESHIPITEERDAPVAPR